MPDPRSPQQQANNRPPGADPVAVQIITAAAGTLQVVTQMLTADRQDFGHHRRLSCRSLQREHPRAEGPRQDCCDPDRWYFELKRYHRCRTELVPAAPRVFQDCRIGPARVSTTSGSPFRAAPNGSRHGMLLRLGVGDITRTCLLW
jgi:hypothetical protein